MVGGVGFGEQDVHLPGHPPGDRVDAVADLYPVLGEGRGEFDDFVLGLRCSKAVAGHDHDFAGVGELQGGVIDGDLAHCAG